MRHPIGWPGLSRADRQITTLARRQHGVVAAHQLRAAGVSGTVVKNRLADGRLRPLHRGVYSIGTHTRLGRWMAAVLAFSPAAVLSHRSAASLHGLRAAAGSQADVTVMRRARGRPGIKVHQARALHPRDKANLEGIPATSVSRTLLDLADVLSLTQLQRAYEQAERQRVLDVAVIDELLERSNGRRGTGALRALLAYDPTRAVAASSELELRFLDLVRGAGLPPPQVNVLVEGFVVDAYWPLAGLVVELQGYAFHSDREAFERDHSRLARLKLAGFEVLALTWRQVSEEPEWVADAIAALLARPPEVGR